MTTDDVDSVLKLYSRRMMMPVLEALRELNGSASRSQVHERVAKNLSIGNQNSKFKKAVDFARLYLVFGGYIDGGERGIWKLTDKGITVDMTDELSSDVVRRYHRYNRDQRALKTSSANAVGDSGVPEKRYWSYRPGSGAKKWQECQDGSVMLIGWGKIGDISQYDSRSEIQQRLRDSYEMDGIPRNAARMLWQFANDMKPGDVVVAIAGTRTILGIGEVQSDYEHYEKSADDFNNARQVSWMTVDDDDSTLRSEKQFHNKTLNDITPNLDMVRQIDELMNDDGEEGDDALIVEEIPLDPYSRKDFLNEVYVGEHTYDNLVSALERKKNIILMGAPGVGKTFIAKRLAYSIMGEKDPSRVTMVQFHQNYSYEDFMFGYRPTPTGGFERKYGVFYEFCKKAEEDEERPYYFVIDEINRGNLSKIFGELFMLIENDKRGLSLRLPDADELFSIPGNVFIIGMMNTADRSLAMIDYALRRRFAFVELTPGFATAGFGKYADSLNNDRFNRLIAAVETLNNEISRDDSLGKGFRIGHSYFCGLNSETVDEQLPLIVEYELIPLIEEYWFDDPAKAEAESENLRAAIR